MRTSHRRLVVLLAAASLLAGCGSEPGVQASDARLATQDEDSSPESAPTPAPTPTPPPPVTHLLRGTFVVTQISQVDQPTDTCTAASLKPAGYEDIHSGAQVTVYDGGQSIIATTTLTGGVLEHPSPQEVPDYSQLPAAPEAPADVHDEAAWDAFMSASNAYTDAYLDVPNKTVYWGFCSFSFETTVADADFYSVEVSHRGKLNLSRAQLEASGWVVDLSL